MKHAVILTCLALCGCAPVPEWYKVPPQHVAPALTIDSREFVSATDMGAEAYFVKDVQALEGGFRWTNAEPEFRFYVRSTANRRLRIDFAVNEITFAQTGPVSIAIKVNGNELTTARYAKPGRYKIEQTVPEGWLHPTTENRIVMQMQNPYVAEDGARLGVLLFGIGFLEQ